MPIILTPRGGSLANRDQQMPAWVEPVHGCRRLCIRKGKAPSPFSSCPAPATSSRSRH